MPAGLGMTRPHPYCKHSHNVGDLIENQSYLDLQTISTDFQFERHHALPVKLSVQQ